MKATTLKKAALAAGSLSFLAGSALAQTAVSGAGGYSTENLLGDGAFNLIGATLHEPIVVSGTFDSQTATSLTDNEVDFSATLTAGTTYLVEITGATASEGMVIEATTWSGNDITGLSGIVADDATDYNIRASATISSIFGAANESGLGSGGTDATSDVVWVPNGSGGFNRYFFADGSDFFVPAGWNIIGGGDPSPATAPINYIDGFFVQRKATGTLPLVITGMVKTDNTSLPISETIGSGFNYFGAAYPVGMTLDNSNFANFVTSGGTDATSDIIWMPDGAGSYDRDFLADGSDFFVPAGWNRIGGGGSGGATPVTTGFVLQRLAGSGDTNGLVTPPAFYANL